MPPRTAVLTAEDISEDDLLATTAHLAPGTNNNIKAGRENARTGKTAMSAKGKAATTKTTTKRKAATTGKTTARRALQDRTNELAGVAEGSENEEEEVEDDAAAMDPPAKRTKTAAAKKTSAKAATTTTAAKKGRAAKKTAATPASTAADLATIPETQPDPAEEPEDVEQSIEVDHEMDIAQVPTPPPAAPRYKQRPVAPTHHAPLLSAPLQPRASSRAPSVPLLARERSGSAAAESRRLGGYYPGGDVELRRQHADLLAKHEELQDKYDRLEAVGPSAANENFAALQQATAASAAAAAKLIEGLRSELEAMRKEQASSAAKAQAERKAAEAAAREKAVAEAEKAREAWKSEKEDLKGKLLAAQNETKALEVKLQAARAQIANGGVNGAATTTILPSNATEAQREAKMKENLYADLTGLIVRNVKRLDGEDVYDCLQTGRNGSESSSAFTSLLNLLLTSHSHSSTLPPHHCQRGFWLCDDATPSYAGRTQL